MSKNSLGELKLSPIKENGKFVFMNNEIRVNGKLNKGDYIKIYVDEYSMQDGKYFLKNNTQPTSKIVVRGLPITQEHAKDLTAVEDLYSKVSEIYKNQFYFGKSEI
jgi:ABC-type phosphate transport system auxiliary subunit